MPNTVSEIQSLNGNASDVSNNVNLQGLGGAMARLGGQPQSGCPNCTGGNNAVAPADGATGAPANLGGLMNWLNPGGGGGPQSAAAANGLPQDAGPQGGEGTWTAEDEQMLDKAVSSTGGGGGPSESSFMGGTKEEFNHLFEQFGQSQEGNCAAIAVIKAALDKYQGKVFQGVQKTGDGYDVSLQDGQKVQVSRADLQTAAKNAKFKSSKPSEAKSMAVLMYAVIGKQMAKAEGGSLEQALDKMGKGQDPKKMAQYLGLGDKIKEVDPNNLQGSEAAVAWNDKHAVYIDDGSKTDAYGQPRGHDGTDTRGGKLTKAFVFV